MLYFVNDIAWGLLKLGLLKLSKVSKTYLLLIKVVHLAKKSYCRIMKSIFYIKNCSVWLYNCLNFQYLSKLKLHMVLEKWKIDIYNKLWSFQLTSSISSTNLLISSLDISIPQPCFKGSKYWHVQVELESREFWGSK